MQKQYKALMLDLDGTTIPIANKGLPTKRVGEAIQKASKKIPVGVATSRAFHYMNYLFDELSLNAPCIVNGGSEIIDAKTKKVLQKEPIQQSDLQAVWKIVKDMGLSLKVDFHDRNIVMTNDLDITNALAAYILPVTTEVADGFIKNLSDIATISAHKMFSPEKDRYYVSVNHAGATKQHGILQVAKLLGIKTQDIIGVGDGHNDMPLLMACGLRIAMENAPDDLKAIADYVAPSFDEDGVADVIEKFIL